MEKTDVRNLPSIQEKLKILQSTHVITFFKQFDFFAISFDRNDKKHQNVLLTFTVHLHRRNESMSSES
jgi:hypothetical protein